MFGYFRIHLLVLTLHLALTSSSFSSLASSSTEDEKQISSTSLKKKLDSLKSEIERNHTKRNIPKLLQLNETFNKLEYDPGQWKIQAERLGVEKWPNQNWKQSIGGHLFYPPQVDRFLSCDSTSHLIGRRDILWAFAIASEHRHPLAQYYLARKLDEIHAQHSLDPRPLLIESLYKESLDILEKCSHIPQSCYILASNYSCDASKVGMREFDLKRSLDLHEKGGQHDSPAGHHNRVALLLKKSIYSSFEPPKVEDYTSIGKYGPAYVHAAHLAKKFKHKEKFLKEATNYDFPQAHLALGALYAQRGMMEEAIKSYEEAGHQDVLRGYILLSQRLVGDTTLKYGLSRDLTQISRGDLERSIDYLRQAGEKGDFEGWNQLVGLYNKLYNLYKNEEDLVELISALEKGLEMGSTYAYYQAQIMFPDKYDQLISFYGSPSHKDLHEYISQTSSFAIEEN